MVEEETRPLGHTSTWAVAAVAASIILVSLILEKIIHKLGKWFTDRHKTALFEALERVKIELMVLGFISLLLTFLEKYIQMICVPKGAADTFMPCHFHEDHTERKLSSFDHRYLAETPEPQKCKHGKVPIISSEGLHDLHILLFFLAVSHVIYSAVTVLLGRLKIRGWRAWEQEAMAPAPDFSEDPSRFRLTHETSFVRAHTSCWTRIPLFFYVGCFFRQFFWSVSRSDYMALRNGFINEHLAPGSKFNFQKYIKRSLEDDFKLLVAVSPILWASFVLFLFLNVYGWKTLYWATAIPPFIILAIGTQLQSILIKMAVEIKERHAVVQGIPLVHGSDKYFWFGRPHFVLHLIHFALFTSVYQIAYFLWNWYSFGLDSCIDGGYRLVIIKVSVGILMICLCSYITLPSYALVTQMGSRMKKSIFDEQTSSAIKKWRKTAAEHNKEGKMASRRLGGGGSVSPAPSPPTHTMRRYGTTGHSGDQEMLHFETQPLTPSPLQVRVDPIQQNHVLAPPSPRPAR